MDIQMPVLDGYQTMKIIRSEPSFADLPILALTANAIDKEIQKCMKSGASDYLSKPFLPEDLFRKMEKLLAVNNKTIDLKNEKVNVETLKTFTGFKPTLIDATLRELIKLIKEEEIDLKTQEIAFQDKVFNDKISIQDKMDSLNLKSEPEDLKFSFYSGQIASLPMAEVLTIVNNDIKEATDSLNLATEINDKTFYKDLLKEGKVPNWNDKKHYWEQDKLETIPFWQNEWLKIKYGFELDGYFIHPWLYFHINFF
jgi:YesN/AraC family two-component response regulator